MKRFLSFLVVAAVIAAAGVFVRVAVVAPAPPERAADAPPVGREEPPVSMPVLTPNPAPSFPALEDKAPAPPVKVADPAGAPSPRSQRQAAPAAPVDPKAYYRGARAALRWVGADPDAEDYWMEAINDPTLSAKQREDLIEDMNEEGFVDPKNPAWEELPLIVNRIQLIEEIAADAMDETNAAAFQEAHKDLTKMYLRLTQ